MAKRKYKRLHYEDRQTIGLTEGYCILGIRVTDYTGKVSETDTESGAEHE